MKVGDLVKATVVDGRPLGLIVEMHNNGIVWVQLIGFPRKDRRSGSIPFRFSQLEVINESR